MTTQKEFGDFQTPLTLAREVIDLIDRNYGAPRIVIEPTVGLGSFLEASAEKWGDKVEYRGYDINADYVRRTRERLRGKTVSIFKQDFFGANWPELLAIGGTKDLLVVGNPPWVTNSALGSLGSKNLPKKSNFQGLRGFDARTGKSNFDIAEWMLITLINSMGSSGTIAMLCKAMTARKVLRHFWKTAGNIAESRIYSIDSKLHFNVAVEACLFVARIGTPKKQIAKVMSSLSAKRACRKVGLVNGQIVSDIDKYVRFQDIGGGSPYTWRSGVKHDAAKVMELVSENGAYRNGFGEFVEIEQDYLYPLLKSSDLGNGRHLPRSFVLVTQQNPNEPTDGIYDTAPKTWAYLERYAKILESRKSSIYQNRPRFSVFGVGKYTFSPWKVAISGLYKTFQFVVIPPVQCRPVLVDDTCYFIPCKSESEARLICDMLMSEMAQHFLSALVFADNKRPITVDVLRQLSLVALAKKLNRIDELTKHLGVYTMDAIDQRQQMNLVMEKAKSTLKSKRRSIRA